MENQVMVVHQQKDPLAWVHGQGNLQYAYTKPAPDRADRAAYLAYAGDVTRLMSKADSKVSDCIGEIINLRHVFAHPVRINMGKDDLGNPVYLDAIRTVLLDEDGYTYECVSEGMVAGLGTIIQLFGDPASWDGPIPVVVKQVNTTNGFRTFNLVVHSGADNGDKPKKRK